MKNRIMKIKCEWISINRLEKSEREKSKNRSEENNQNKI